MTALTSPDVHQLGRVKSEDVHRCERGKRCRGSVRDEAGDLTGAACDRPLCDPCETAVARALEEAPALYRQVRAATLVRAAAVRSEMVTASKGSPLPLNGHALHLGESVWWLLVSWEDEVRRIAGLTGRVRYGKREGRQVQDAAALLGVYLSAWVAAPSTAFVVNSGRDSWWSRDGQRQATDAAVEQSGAQAAVALLDWRSAVRLLPGVDPKAPKAVRRYEQRCPACSVRAITHRAGDDLMQCQNCAATQPYLPTLPREADYQLEAAS